MPYTPSPNAAAQWWRDAAAAAYTLNSQSGSYTPSPNSYAKWLYDLAANLYGYAGEGTYPSPTNAATHMKAIANALFIKTNQSGNYTPSPNAWSQWLFDAAKYSYILNGGSTYTPSPNSASQWTHDIAENLTAVA